MLTGMSSKDKIHFPNDADAYDLLWEVCYLSSNSCLFDINTALLQPFLVPSDWDWSKCNSLGGAM